MSSFQWEDIDLNAGNTTVGTLKNLNLDALMGDVCDDDGRFIAKDIPIHYHCEEDSTDDGESFDRTYPDDLDTRGGLAFANEDSVLLMYRRANNKEPIIIGFANEARACSTEFFNIVLPDNSIYTFDPLTKGTSLEKVAQLAKSATFIAETDISGKKLIISFQDINGAVWTSFDDGFSYLGGEGTVLIKEICSGWDAWSTHIDSKDIYDQYGHAPSIGFLTPEAYVFSFGGDEIGGMYTDDPDSKTFQTPLIIDGEDLRMWYNHQINASLYGYKDILYQWNSDEKKYEYVSLSTTVNGGWAGRRAIYSTEFSFPMSLTPDMKAIGKSGLYCLGSPFVMYSNTYLSGLSSDTLSGAVWLSARDAWGPYINLQTGQMEDGVIVSSELSYNFDNIAVTWSDPGEYSCDGSLDLSMIIFGKTMQYSFQQTTDLTISASPPYVSGTRTWEANWPNHIYVAHPFLPILVDFEFPGSSSELDADSVVSGVDYDDSYSCGNACVFSGKRIRSFGEQSIAENVYDGNVTLCDIKNNRTIKIIATKVKATFEADSRCELDSSAPEVQVAWLSVESGKTNDYCLVRRDNVYALIHRVETNGIITYEEEDVSEQITALGSIKAITSRIPSSHDSDI